MESYVLASVKDGTVQAFEADGTPIAESKGRLKHHATSHGEWLLCIVLLASHCGIKRIEFINGASIEVKTTQELVSQLRGILR